MKIAIISASNRKNSNSLKIAKYLQDKYINIKYENYLLNLADKKLDLWEEGVNSSIWPDISKHLGQAAGFIFVIPEWHGMAPPHIKNLFFFANNYEFFHKPGLLVSISSGDGGAYVISDMRSSSYKNHYINWIPDHLIIRHIDNDFPNNIPEKTQIKINYVMNNYFIYIKACKEITNQVERIQPYPHGM